MNKTNLSRRSFVKKSAMGVGAVGAGANLSGKSLEPVKDIKSTVYFAGVSCEGITADTSQEMVNKVEKEMENLLFQKPDIIALPELFPFYWDVKEKMSIEEQANYSQKVLKRFSSFARSGAWEKNWTCARVNLNRVVIHSWPYVKKFDEIQKKYGQRIRLTHLHNEAMSIIESLSDDIRVADILKEYDIMTHAEHLAYSQKLQEKASY